MTLRIFTVIVLVAYSSFLLSQSKGFCYYTGHSNDVIVIGNGCFKVLNPNDNKIYVVKSGRLVRDLQGYLAFKVGAKCYRITKEINIDSVYDEYYIMSDGNLRCKIPNTEEYTTVGQIELINVINLAPDSLEIAETPIPLTNLAYFERYHVNKPGISSLGILLPRWRMRSWWDRYGLAILAYSTAAFIALKTIYDNSHCRRTKT